MGPARDPYEVLGVSRSASQAEIRAAYRDLVKRYHPDKHHDNPLEDLAAERLTEINQAYAAVGEPDARASHDGTVRSRAPAGSVSQPTRNGGRDSSVGGSSRVPSRGTSSPALAQIVKLGWTILFLSMLLKFGGLVAREAFALLRVVFQGLFALRANPLALIVVVLALVFLYAGFRRRRGA